MSPISRIKCDERLCSLLPWTCVGKTKACIWENYRTLCENHCLDLLHCSKHCLLRAFYRFKVFEVWTENSPCTTKLVWNLHEGARVQAPTRGPVEPEGPPPSARPARPAARPAAQPAQPRPAQPKKAPKQTLKQPKPEPELPEPELPEPELEEPAETWEWDEPDEPREPHQAEPEEAAEAEPEPPQPEEPWESSEWEQWDTWEPEEPAEPAKPPKPEPAKPKLRQLKQPRPGTAVQDMFHIMAHSISQSHHLRPSGPKPAMKPAATRPSVRQRLWDHVRTDLGARYWWFCIHGIHHHKWKNSWNRSIKWEAIFSLHVVQSNLAIHSSEFAQMSSHKSAGTDLSETSQHHSINHETKRERERDGVLF